MGILGFFFSTWLWTESSLCRLQFVMGMSPVMVKTEVLDATMLLNSNVEEVRAFLWVR